MAAYSAVAASQSAVVAVSELIMSANVASPSLSHSLEREFMNVKETEGIERGKNGDNVGSVARCTSDDTHHVPYLNACLHLQGILDMLVLSRAEGKNDLIIHALKNNFEADAYFVKVMGK